MMKNKRRWTGYIKDHYPSLLDDELKTIYRKLCKVWLKYKIGPGDFYMLQCEDKTMHQISGFLSWWESSCFCMEVNSTRARRVLGNKYSSYMYFSKFYGRRALLLSPAEIGNGKAYEKLSGLFGVGQRNRFIIKPLNLDSGKGIKIMSSVSDIIDYVKTLDRDVIIEDVIEQDDSMAAFNYSSVNTIRINTVNYRNGEIDVIWPCFRMGRAGCVVDNAGHGGIFAAIDAKTGTTIAAADETRNMWEEHPDTKKKLVDIMIPKWPEAVAFAKELASAIPDAGFVAWDLALTKHGWVMVEGNGAPLIIYQIALRKGLRSEFCEMKKKMQLSVSKIDDLK